MSGFKTALAGATAAFAINAAAQSPEAPPEVRADHRMLAAAVVDGLVRSETCTQGFNGAVDNDPRYAGTPKVEPKIFMSKPGNKLENDYSFAWGIHQPGYTHGSMGPEELQAMCGKSTFKFIGQTPGRALEAAVANASVLGPAHQYANNIVRNGIVENMRDSGTLNTPSFQNTRAEAAEQLAKVFSVMYGTVEYEYSQPMINVQLRQAALPKSGPAVAARQRNAAPGASGS